MDETRKREKFVADLKCAQFRLIYCYTNRKACVSIYFVIYAS